MSPTRDAILQAARDDDRAKRLRKRQEDSCRVAMRWNGGHCLCGTHEPNTDGSTT